MRPIFTPISVKSAEIKPNQEVVKWMLPQESFLYYNSDCNKPEEYFLLRFSGADKSSGPGFQNCTYSIVHKKTLVMHSYLVCKIKLLCK